MVRKLTKKPELGNKPSWVENIQLIEVKTRNAFDSIRTAQPEKAKYALFANCVSDVLRNIEIIAHSNRAIGDHEEVIVFYKGFDEIREEYLALLEYSIYVNEAEKIINKQLEQVAKSVYGIGSASGSLAKVFIHEIFLYTIAYFLKSEDYSIVGYLLSRPFYNFEGYTNKISGFDIFYSGRCDALDRAMKNRDNKNYICGTATYWLENIDERYTKEQLILADLVCYNYSIYGKDILLSYPWFPLTYIYDNQYESCIGSFSGKLISREYVEQLLLLFGYDTVEEFKEKLKQVSEEIKQQSYRRMRFSESWNNPGLISDFITPEKIGTVR
ncbi:MAG: hypothetical protein K6A80_10165 [Saccharofermentans sp.]|nr:hypothetical protein [Saccharofermentans sp.]